MEHNIVDGLFLHATRHVSLGSQPSSTDITVLVNRNRPAVQRITIRVLFPTRTSLIGTKTVRFSPLEVKDKVSTSQRKNDLVARSNRFRQEDFLSVTNIIGWYDAMKANIGCFTQPHAKQATVGSTFLEPQGTGESATSLVELSAKTMAVHFGLVHDKMGNGCHKALSIVVTNLIIIRKATIVEPVNVKVTSIHYYDVNANFTKTSINNRKKSQIQKNKRKV